MCSWRSHQPRRHRASNKFVFEPALWLMNRLPSLKRILDFYPLETLHLPVWVKNISSLGRKKKPVARACSWGIWRSAYQRKWYPPPFSLSLFIPFLFILLSIPLSPFGKLWSLEFSGPWLPFHSPSACKSTPWI